MAKKNEKIFLNERLEEKNASIKQLQSELDALSKELSQLQLETNRTIEQKCQTIRQQE